jgi:hypothetical protein
MGSLEELEGVSLAGTFEIKEKVYHFLESEAIKT